MYYYLANLPQEKNYIKILEKCNSSEKYEILFSNEGIFKVTNKVFQLIYNDDINPSNLVIDNIKLICDNTKINHLEVKKIPYKYIKNSINKYNFIKKNITLTIELTNDELSNIYFMVKDPSIYEIKNEIKNWLDIIYR